MTITPVIDNRPSKSGEHAVKIRLNIGDKIKYFPVNASVLKTEWNKKNGRVKATRQNYAEINMKILSMVTDIEKNALSGKAPDTTNHSDFYYWYEGAIKDVRKNGCEKNAVNYEYAMNDLKIFRPILLVQDVDFKFLKDYKRHWVGKRKENDEPYADTTIMHQFNKMRKVVLMARDAGALEHSKNPFLHFKISYKKKENKRTDAVGITKLENFTSENANLLKTRDMYLFSYYNGGIRWGDLCRLPRPNINDLRLKYTANKRKNMLSLKLREKSIEIIKKQELNIDGKLFNLNVNWKNEWKSIDNRNGGYNKLLKKICKLLDIPKLTFHTTRHTLVDKLIKEKTPIEIISQILGHSKISTTQNSYAKELYEEEIDEAMDNAYGT